MCSLVYFRQAKIFPIFRNVRNYLLTPTAKFILKVMIENIKQSFTTGKNLDGWDKKKVQTRKGHTYLAWRLTMIAKVVPLG